MDSEPHQSDMPLNAIKLFGLTLDEASNTTPSEFLSICCTLWGIRKVWIKVGMVYTKKIDG